MHSALVVATLILSSLSAVAQQPRSGVAPPFQAKRLPPEKVNATVGDSAHPLDDSPLQNIDGLDLSSHSDPVPLQAPGQASAPAATAATVPPGFKPKTDVQLNKTAQEAVQMSEKWMAGHNQPAVGQDGRVLYSYGAGLPTVVCAPLRVCIVELQSGERLVGEPHIGDSVRWNISPAMFGHGDSATTAIVLKPQSPGLDTNLLITTDRRAYYLRLLSKPEDYVARVAFAYPDDDGQSAKWQEQIAKQKEQDQKNSIAELPGRSVDSLCFDYRVKGKQEALKPLRVFDDGQKTFIQISRDTQTREAPVLVVLGRDGKQEMVNYRVKGDMYIVDRLFDRAALILGTGKKAQKVEIDRERKS
ncbi:MAG: P-type conjugative transfer protein TrbG [Bryobacteraceae bacterium]